MVMRNFNPVDFRLWSRFHGEVGNIPQEPLGTPRNLRGMAETAGARFSWLPPVSFGANGPSSTNRYGYRVRFTLQGGPAITTRPWSGIRRLNTNTLLLNWENNQAIQMTQIQVRAYDNAGGFSGWVTSEVVTEGVDAGRFRGRFSGRFG